MTGALTLIKTDYEVGNDGSDRSNGRYFYCPYRVLYPPDTLLLWTTRLSEDKNDTEKSKVGDPAVFSSFVHFYPRRRWWNNSHFCSGLSPVDVVVLVLVSLTPRGAISKKTESRL